MKKCKYAGDVNDEYCKSCDGCTMMLEGQEMSCEKCLGYEPGTEDVETDIEIKETPTEIPVENTENKVENTPKTDENTISDINIPIEEKTVKSQVILNEKESQVDGVTVKSIRYMSGCTVVRNDVYYKFTAEEEWELNPDMTAEQISDAREKLWTMLNNEVDSQVADLK